MKRAFSKVLSGAEGRYLTSIEAEQSYCSALELPHRIQVSRALQQFEFEIVDFATHSFCDIVADFDGPSGSIRRKKGHQDGRIMLRFVAQAVREGSAEILFEKVLSWLIGHLDASNVTGTHIEMFCHFLQQGVHRELPPSMRPFVDDIFEDMIQFIRQASHSGTIHRAHRRIAEFAVDRIMTLMPEAKAKYGVASIPKCKRDLELLVKELARVMRTPSPDEMKRQFTSWVLDRLISQVDYDQKVWYWTFLAIREGIVECCGPDAAIAVNELFESMADHVVPLMESIQLSAAAGELADSAANRLLERGESLGLLRTDEFQTAVSMVNRQLISEIAVMHACGVMDSQYEQLANLWCNLVLPLMPASHTSLLAANLKALLESVEEKFNAGPAVAFRNSILQLVEVARRSEAATRLSEIVDKVSIETADWAIENFSQFSADKRASYRDVRIVLSKIVSLIPSGPAGVNGGVLREYLTSFLLPNLPFNVSILRQVYERAMRSIDTHARPEDAKLMKSYIDDLMGCFDRHSRLALVAAHSDKFAISAVERGYQAEPRHPSLEKHGIKAGRRDGKFLVEKAIQCAIIGGPYAEAKLHHYFLNEQVRFSKLPGGVILEFLRGLLEQLREYPEIAELLLGLAHAAPCYSAAFKINRMSTDLAAKISEASTQSSPAYRDQIGAVGLESCKRDNAVMLRGLSHFLMNSPGDVSSFKAWWKERIGKNIRQKPENFDSNGPCAKTNFQEVLSAFRVALDRDEADAVESYMKQVFAGRGSMSSESNRGSANRIIPANAFVTAPQMLTFSDVIPS